MAELEVQTSDLQFLIYRDWFESDIKNTMDSIKVTVMLGVNVANTFILNTIFF